MRLTLIAAMTKARVIGKDNKLLWSLPEDMKHFKETTTDATVIMGRKTFESIGRPLPNRNNIVLSRSFEELEGVIVCTTKEDALKAAEKFGKEVFVIGGAQIYQMFLEDADRLIISLVNEDYEGDTYFPAFDDEFFKEVSRKRFDDFSIFYYERKKK